ncbi:MAG: DUF3386 family protein [Candidatus Nitrohelix vancouverensis]|uniref:DUF3386 family protein n=1 Tax=Candidatus Nitrohelix vancouverensis TaxID=2705534 RepID=A0A7T0G4I0_9BACT|nr:MAG: DUF3386 family protein [Candidatus Nitrohelix vancouverensis]
MATYAKEKDVETAVEEDPKAREALREVFGNTARWDAEFKGFTANVVVNINGVEEACKITVKGPKEIETDCKGEAAKSFLTENMASIAMHRGPRSFEESDGKYKLHFMDDGAHPLGRAVAMGGDGMSSFYRIKDGRIHQINRKTPRFSFSINVEESVKNEEGKFLTRRYTVYYFKPEGDGLKDVESYTDEYTRVGAYDLPKYRRVINNEDGSICVNAMTLSSHKVL